MPSDSSSVDTLKENLLRAVDAEYNVLKAETVLEIISQLETMHITRDQLNTTRLGREINSIRQKIDAQKKSVQPNETYSESMIEIAQRAKKLLRSWQGLLNTSQTNEHHSPSIINGDTKPRLILKVKLNSPLAKRKHDIDDHFTDETNIKRRKPPIDSNSCLPRLKTTQQLLMEMQRHEPHILSTPTSTINSILHKKIIDESVQTTAKLDHPALHHVHANSIHYQKQLSNVTPPIDLSSILGSSLKLQPVVQRLSSNFIVSNTNGENGCSTDSDLSSFEGGAASRFPSTGLSEPPITVPVISKKKRRKKSDTHQLQTSTIEESRSDIATICASYSTVADLVADHRRQMIAVHDARELEARPDLLLVPIDQLAFVYEREMAKELDLPPQSASLSITTVQKLRPPLDLVALPYIDCTLEFDLLLDELVVQDP